MPERIAALVISYNRIAELQGAVEALRAQTRAADAIVVVDNGSTDGSREWAEQQPDVHLIRQGNVGASGAIRAGQKYCLANGFDWVWCFDDDAHPAPHALQALYEAMRARPDGRVFNSVGMSRAHPKRFAVGALWVRKPGEYYLDGVRVETLEGLTPFADAYGIVDSVGGHFYHGVLFHRTVIEDAGSPLPWLYMCGEELEYGYRIMRAGYPIYAVTGSVVSHPEVPFARFQLLGMTKEFEIRTARHRHLLIRNSLWIHRTYFGSPLLPYVARRLGGAVLAELFVIPGKTLRERLDSCAAALRGVRDGLQLQPARDANGNPILT